MPKETPEKVQPSEVAAELSPASYKLVGLDPSAVNLHVPLVSREYTIKELQRTDILEMLHRLGWPHVEKN